MSRLVVIEDTLETQLEVVAAIKGTEHSNVRTVWDLPQAHQTLIDLALGDLEADYLLVDGNLGARASDNLEFRFTPPGMELPPIVEPTISVPTKAPKRRGWRGVVDLAVDKALDAAVDLIKSPAPTPVTPPAPRHNPHEIVVGYMSEGPQIQADGRQVCRIVRALGLDVQIIGISGDDASYWGGDVDYDLTKRRISKLASFLDEIEEQK